MEDGRRKTEVCPVYTSSLVLPCTTLPCTTRYYTYPGYTAYTTAAADVIHTLTAREAGAGRTVWAQTELPSLGSVLLLTNLPRVVTVLRKKPPGWKDGIGQERVKDWIERGHSCL